MTQTTIEISVEGVEKDELPEDVVSNFDEEIYRKLAEDYDVGFDSLTVELVDND